MTHLIKRGLAVLPKSRTTISLARCIQSSTSLQDDKKGEVYYGKTTSRVRKTRIISISSSVLSTVLTPVILYKKFHLSAAMISVMSGMPITLTYMYTGAVYFMTKNYVAEMYMKSPDCLVVKKFGFLWWLRATEISPKDVEVPVDQGMLESFRVKGKGYLIDEQLITDKDLYACVTGQRGLNKVESKESEPLD